MKTFRITLLNIASLIIIRDLILIDYSDLSFRTNAGGYLGVLSMMLQILLLVMSFYKKK